MGSSRFLAIGNARLSPTCGTALSGHRRARMSPPDFVRCSPFAVQQAVSFGQVSRSESNPGLSARFCECARRGFEASQCGNRSQLRCRGMASPLVNGTFSRSGRRRCKTSAPPSCFCRCVPRTTGPLQGQDWLVSISILLVSGCDVIGPSQTKQNRSSAAGQSQIAEAASRHRWRSESAVQCPMARFRSETNRVVHEHHDVGFRRGTARAQPGCRPKC